MKTLAANAAPDDVKDLTDVKNATGAAAEKSATDTIDATDSFSPPAPDERIQRSLFGEILDWMLVPLLLLWPVSIAVTYLVAKSIANQPFDQALEDRVTVLAQQVKEIGGSVVAPLPSSARDILRADDVDNVYFQVIGPNGELIDGEREVPAPAEDDHPQPWAVHVRSDTLHNADVRIAWTWVELNRRPGGVVTEPRLALVQVGETLDKRVQLANQIIKGVILPEFIILPIALALVWFALTRGLSPLTDLQRRIRARRADDLSPIDSSQVPEEISPLVASLNDMLGRLSQNIAMQKRFIADAAHQMKTPLAGMRMQSELALRQVDQNEIHRSLEQLARSSESATRLINQLLSLARAENQGPQASRFVSLDLCDLARTVVQDWVQQAMTRQIDFGFEQPEHAVMVHGNPTLLREMLGNLIDNALRYTPIPGHVTVRVAADFAAGLALLEVEDSGPGIPPAERTHVFERFYRILGTLSEGSGLGLAIVREVAQQHDATIELAANPRSQHPNMPGCLVRLAFVMKSSPSFVEGME